MSAVQLQALGVGGERGCLQSVEPMAGVVGSVMVAQGCRVARGSRAIRCSGAWSRALGRWMRGVGGMTDARGSLVRYRMSSSPVWVSRVPRETEALRRRALDHFRAHQCEPWRGGRSERGRCEPTHCPSRSFPADASSPPRRVLGENEDTLGGCGVAPRDDDRTAPAPTRGVVPREASGSQWMPPHFGQCWASPTRWVEWSAPGSYLNGGQDNRCRGGTERATREKSGGRGDRSGVRKSRSPPSRPGRQDRPEWKSGDETSRPVRDRFEGAEDQRQATARMAGGGYEGRGAEHRGTTSTPGVNVGSVGYPRLVPSSRRWGGAREDSHACVDLECDEPLRCDRWTPASRWVRRSAVRGDGVPPHAAEQESCRSPSVKGTTRRST